MTELFIILAMFIIVIALICSMGFVRINKKDESKFVKAKQMRIESIVEFIEE